MSEKKFHAKSTALEVVEGHDLTGYEIIVTGASSGIGVETVRALAKAGARCIIGARDLVKAESVAQELRKDTGNDEIEVEKLELDSLESVRDFVKRFLIKKRHLNILINNAGIMAGPLSYTKDGFESQFGTNHIGHFALTHGLIPALKEAAKLTGKKSRVVSVTSIAHIISDVDMDDVNFKVRAYDPWVSYGQSKTANILFSVALTKLYADQGIISNAVMPGGIMTGLQKHVPREEQIKRGWINENNEIITEMKNTEQGASTSVWAAVAPELDEVGGLYLENCSIAVLRNSQADARKDMSGFLSHAVNEENALKLWGCSLNWIQ